MSFNSMLLDRNDNWRHLTRILGGQIVNHLFQYVDFAVEGSLKQLTLFRTAVDDAMKSPNTEYLISSESTPEGELRITLARTRPTKHLIYSYNYKVL